MSLARDLSSLARLEDRHTPHIIPDVLYPAVSGKLLNGTTSHSGNYGTAQSDGRKYYYTDIKGSKPIRDPRIGAHFGSQRHKAKTVQLLEQETATHGKNVYSIDGREWMRAVGGWGTLQHSSTGNFVDLDANSYANDHSFIEIVGYFNDANIIKDAYHSNNDIFGVIINGGTRQSNDLAISITSAPLGGRYVDAGSLVNLSFNSAPTLGINTLKIGNTNGAFLSFYGIELIAQDTTSATTRNQIQIPAQKVVTKGTIQSVTAKQLHYNPFAFKTDGSTSWTAGNHNGTSWPVGTGSSHNIDTANSLGLEKWLHSSNYYYPYNGGRVVIYVDSDGTIKTAVTVMPPNAKSIGDSSSLTNATAKANASASNNTFYPTFEAHTSSVDEDLLSEVAKKFHYREFGNGAANGGTGATWADASMLNSADDIAYCMDDGLTSIAGDDVYATGGGTYADISGSANGDGMYFTFIGTGVTITNTYNSAGTDTIAQNLPYGTHIFRYYREDVGGSTANPDIIIDGINIGNPSLGNYNQLSEITFHQPKRPPIPEDACVIADYMLMADYKPQTVVGIEHISKGTRLVSASRDLFYNAGSAFSHYQSITSTAGFQTDSGANSNVKFKLPFFGKGIEYRWSNHSTYAMVNANFFLDGTAATTGNFSALSASTPSGSYNASTGVLTPTSGTRNGEFLSVTGLNLDSQTVSVESASNPSGNARFRIDSFAIETPIHTSSHYQPFETPFLHELIGGDRNMEQTNLVVSPDGRSWDQITRDTSYLGGLGINTDASSNQNTIQNLLFTEWRGKIQGASFYNKGFAIAYDRVICLIPGRYRIFYSTHADSGTNSGWSEIRVNGLEAVAYYTWGSNYTNPVGECVVDLARSDFVQVFGSAKADLDCQSIFNIEQV